MVISQRLSLDDDYLRLILFLSAYCFCLFAHLDSDKDKLCLDDNLAMGGIDIGPSASLTPAIWDKTIPYDGENFHLEYMDLEEFLLENGIANATAAIDDSDSDMGSSGGSSPKKVPKAQAAVAPKGPSATATLLPPVALDQSEEVVSTSELDVESEICIGEWGHVCNSRSQERLSCRSVSGLVCNTFPFYNKKNKKRTGLLVCFTHKVQEKNKNRTHQVWSNENNAFAYICFFCNSITSYILFSRWSKVI